MGSKFFTFIFKAALKQIGLTAICLLCSFAVMAQPANDDCNNASLINIGNVGFQTGIFISDTVDISAATMQTGETVPTSLFVAGQHQKSVWFKFSISTTRKLKVTLKQPGIAITNGNVGFTVYRTYNCVPGNAQVSSKLTPLEVFGSSFHPCVDSGMYYVQVSSKLNANGPIFVELEVATTDADYDERTSAYQFGLMNTAAKHVIYDVNCHSIENLSETCIGTLPSASSYTKSSWHTFITPAYFDYITMMVASGNTPYFTNATTQHIIGYKLYEGDATTTQISGLTLIDGCDTLRTTGNRPGYRTYRCGMLDPNKTYSLQLFFKTDFEASVRVGLIREGVAPAKGPIPDLSQMHPDNVLGNLPFGLTTRTDYFACNSRHSISPCGTTKPANGVSRPGTRYNLSTYFTYNLPQAGNVEISVNNAPGFNFCRNMLVRIFKSNINNNCTTVDTSSLYAEFTTSILTNNVSRLYNCMPDGNYVIQILGTDTMLNTFNYTYPTTSTNSLCLYNNFGQAFELKITHTQVHSRNNFSLFQSGAVDNVNNGLPLLLNNTHFSTVDTFGCFNAPLPGAGNCAAAFRKAMYRQITVSDSVAMIVGNLSPTFSTLTNNIQVDHYYRYQFYKGNANTLATAQNTWINPDTFSGLIRYSNCFLNTASMPRFCLEPGTYTLVTQGDDNFINRTDRPSFTTTNFTTLHYSPATTENMGDILSIVTNPLGGSVTSGVDRFSCLNNAITIDGVAPCNNTTKAIYREFYLSAPTTIGITSTNSKSMAVFSGRLSTVGFTGLTSVSGCSGGYWGGECRILPAGWYTVVSYGNGSAYTSPFVSDITSNSLGLENTVIVTVLAPCNAPKYNRPYKAAIDTTTNLPFLLQWNAAASANAYPVTGVTYTLPSDYVNCIADTPFSLPITPCGTAVYNRISYYVVRLTQVSYLNIGSNSAASLIKIYKGNVRTDSLLFPSLTPILPCANTSGARIEMCKVQPGTYTIVMYHPIQTCNVISPVIYIDEAATSRFDHANNAYDFGIVPDNNVYQGGKVGDVNPLNPGRAPSNDFFYCTTGAQTTDPTNTVCLVAINPSIYSVPDSNVVQWPVTSVYSTSRRNLWYTFQVNKPGWVKVKVDNKTPNMNNQLPFAIYRSDVNGALNFQQVVSQGLVDSTLAQGLTFIGYNGLYGQLTCDGRNVDSFFIPPCTFDTAQRYYIMVDNRSHFQIPLIMRPNHQVEVFIALNPVPQVNTQFNYYATAGDMGTIGVGTHNGTLDNYTCATANTSYPIPMPACAQKTLWYKFKVAPTVYGTAKIRLLINGTIVGVSPDDFLLLKETTVNDSTANGLTKVVLSNIANYRQACVEENATYYLLLTGCNRSTETVVPQIIIEQNVGDYCSDRLVANVTGPGSFSATALVDCHTIGTDYGELNTTLSCPPNALTEQYKSTWFRIDVTGTDTLDLTVALQENTTASGSQIQYRMMTGTCAAMQEQSCVFNSQTQNTYQCLIPGLSYYIQVLSPKNYFNNDPEFPTLGTITLQANAIQHIDTCSPITNCLINANYTWDFDCNTNDSVFFNNYSTFGTAVDYLWDFGYNSQTSTTFAPRFRYPALPTAATYTVSLRAINTSCNDTAYSVQTITIPARPEVNLGNDTSVCDPNAVVVLNATSHPGSTYLWQDNSTNATYSVSAQGTNTYYVAVTFATCTVRDSIDVYISPLVQNPTDTVLLCDNHTAAALDATRTFVGTSYNWFNASTTPTIVVPSTGTYWVDVTLNGCSVRDTFVVQENLDTLSVLGNDTAICNFAAGYILDASIAGATDYLWQDFSITTQYNLTSPGNYWVMVTFANGCAYTDSINITSLPLPEATVHDTICNGAFYILPSNDTAFTTGIYVDTFAVSGACDSVVTTHLVVLDSIFVIDYDTICIYNLPYVWNGITVNTGGANVATYTSSTQQGCDSTAILNLHLKTVDSTHVNQQVCVYILPFVFYGNNLNASGTYYHTLSGSSGCDSVIVMHLQVVTEYRDTLLANICGNDSYTYNNVTYTTPGYYQHSFPSNSGCDSFVVLHLTQTPVPNAPLVISPIGYCLNTSANALSAVGSNLKWYTSPVGGIGSSIAPTPTTGTIGQQFFYVSQSINGCESPRSEIIVIINPKPLADFTVVPDSIMCMYDSVTVTFTGNQLPGSNLVWQWDGAMVTGNDPGPYIAYWQTSGVKTLRLWVDNAGCISDTAVKRISIKNGPTLPEIELPDYVCVEQTITIKGLSNFSAPVNYLWQYDNTPLQQGASFNMVWTEPGKHFFTLSLEYDGCVTPPVSDTIEVMALPEAEIEAFSIINCLEDTITVRALPSTGQVSYTWSPAHYFRDGLSNQGQEVKVFVSAPGYLVLEVKNQYDCKNYDTISIETKKCCDIFVPNAFSPNGDGLNDELKLYTATRQELEEFAIYNRYGQRVFITNSINSSWDGSYNGKQGDVAVYSYYLKFTCADGTKMNKVGEIHLIR